MKWYIVLPTIVFLISCCDLGATLYFDKTCDYFEEANPIAVHIWDTYGDSGLITFKLTVTLVSCLCLGWVLANKNKSWRIAATMFGVSACCLLIGWWIFWFFV